VSVASADRCLEAMGNWRREDDLESIACPTQIVWGEHDRSYAWAEQLKLWSRIKDVSLAVLPRASHAAHLEAPGLFETVVGEFMRNAYGDAIGASTSARR
jgi:2-hydroxy-6-oxonona-2,4-dienedioate hydrolase